MGARPLLPRRPLLALLRGLLLGTNHSAIGVATSATGLPGTWTDHGKVFSSETTDTWNAIDPAVVRADGRLWMSFGSYWSGIRMVELDPATGKAVEDARVHHLATRPDEPYAVEGPEIVKHGRYYYLFASTTPAARV